MRHLALMLLAGCGLDAIDPGPPPDQLPAPPARKGLNELSPTSVHGPTGAIATNGIVNVVTAPVSLGGTALPARALPNGRVAPLPGPVSVAAIGGLLVPDELIVNIGLGAFSLEGGTGVAAPIELAGVGFEVSVAGAIVNDVPIDVDRTGIAVSRCKVSGLSTANAAVLDLDLDGEDLNELVVQGLPLAGRPDLAAGVWVTGLSASSMVCDCARGLPMSDVELSECLSIDRPYNVSLLVRATTPDVVMPIPRLHIAVSDQIANGDPTPLCSSGIPTTDTACTLAGGDFASGTCGVSDKDGDGAPGYVLDSVEVGSLDAYLRAAASASFKVAFDRRITATLTCSEPQGPDLEYDFTGEIGASGLFGSTRWTGSDPQGVVQQRWFSAAFMALLNPWKQRVHVSLRHPDRGPATFGSGRPWPIDLRPFQPQLDLDGDGIRELDLTARFTIFDGVYFGNLFAGACAPPDVHPDCAAKFRGVVAHIRLATLTGEPRVIQQQNAMAQQITLEECITAIEGIGLAFDPERHYPNPYFSLDVHWCISDPRTCAISPVFNMQFCPFDSSGFADGMTPVCTAAADPRLGFTDCDTLVAGLPRWSEQLAVYLATDRAERYEIDDDVTCRAVNRLRIATGGCTEPTIADCDGDGIPDGCFDATR